MLWLLSIKYSFVLKINNSLIKGSYLSGILIRFYSKTEWKIQDDNKLLSCKMNNNIIFRKKNRIIKCHCNLSLRFRAYVKIYGFLLSSSNIFHFSNYTLWKNEEIWFFFFDNDAFFIYQFYYFFLFYKEEINICMYTYRIMFCHNFSKSIEKNDMKYNCKSFLENDLS